ncbi:MAG TPA: type II toxin-antitoxin system RelE/ParE family toxin [Aestuariivirga sp.]|nr:type II toxin-antitoxin system RelE/ParE family toxin [Aestuariivirga sp.]
MKQREVVFSPEAIDDLNRLYDWIVSVAGSAVAFRYIERIEAFCMGLDLASERGVLREDIRPGLRVVGFERRLTVAFSVDLEIVTIHHLFYGGQKWEEAFA